MVVFAVSRCGKSSGGGVSGTSKIRMGASTTAPARLVSQNYTRPSTNQGDHWRLSPNKAKVTFTKITFFTNDGNSSDQTFSGCTATYDRAQASGSLLLDCPITVPIGTITRMMVYYSTTFQISISDSTNSIYTDSTKTSGFSATAPAAGNEFATFVATAQQNNNGDFVADIHLPTPKVVAANDTPTINIVTDMIHSMFATAGSTGTPGAVLTYDSTDVHAPVNIFATFSDSGSSEFYTATGTAENYNFTTSTSEYMVRLFYYSNSTPAFVMNEYVDNCVMGNYPTQALNANPASSTADSSDGSKAGGYLGIDSGSVLAWALPETFAYSSYRALLTMARVAKGSTTSLNCKAVFGAGGTVPAPSSGDVYSSNNAALTASPTHTVSGLKLVAN